MDKFTLTIILGNEEMENALHVALALREVADKLDILNNMQGVAIEDERGGIRDVNGNRVGEWRFE